MDFRAPAVENSVSGRTSAGSVVAAAAAAGVLVAVAVVGAAALDVVAAVIAALVVSVVVFVADRALLAAAAAVVVGTEDLVAEISVGRLLSCRRVGRNCWDFDRSVDLVGGRDSAFSAAAVAVNSVAVTRAAAAASELDKLSLALVFEEAPANFRNRMIAGARFASKRSGQQRTDSGPVSASSRPRTEAESSGLRGHCYVKPVAAEEGARRSPCMTGTEGTFATLDIMKRRRFVAAGCSCSTEPCMTSSSVECPWDCRSRSRPKNLEPRRTFS